MKAALFFMMETRVPRNLGSMCGSERLPPNQVPKPETDPDWEERKAQWDAERKHKGKGKKRSRQPEF